MLQDARQLGSTGAGAMEDIMFSAGTKENHPTSYLDVKGHEGQETGSCQT